MAEVMLFHYRDRKTFLNRANPLTKIVLIMLFSYTLLNTVILRAAAITIVLVIAATVIRLPIRQYRHEIRFFIVMGVVIGVSRYLSTKEVSIAITAVIGFLDIVLMGMVFADTTAPDDLSRSLGSLLSPIPKIKGERIAATLELTLSTVPLLFDVSAQIRDARAARLENRWGHPLKRLVSYASAVFTLLLDRAEDLSMALQARLFDVDAKRDSLPIRSHDAVMLLTAGMIVAILLKIN